MNKSVFLVILSVILLLGCKSQSYQIVNIHGQIIEMSDTYDFKTDSHKDLTTLVNNHKNILDTLMNEVIGESTTLMAYGYPESPLTNFTSDAMKQYGDKHLTSGADLAIMNVHGHRATMPKGTVTLGNLYEIYSFDNTITFLKLKGSDLKLIFNSYARMGGSGISSNVKLVIKNKTIKSATVNGKKVDENKIYNIVTLDYLADGNNGMGAFLHALEVNNTGITLRDIMIDYVKDQTNKNKKLSSQNDGRIIIEN